MWGYHASTAHNILMVVAFLPSPTVVNERFCQSPTVASPRPDSTASQNSLPWHIAETKILRQVLRQRSSRGDSCLSCPAALSHKRSQLIQPRRLRKRCAGGVAPHVSTTDCGSRVG